LVTRSFNFDDTNRIFNKIDNPRVTNPQSVRTSLNLPACGNSPASDALPAFQQRALCSQLGSVKKVGQHDYDFDPWSENFVTRGLAKYGHFDWLELSCKSPTKTCS
jgi:hypothetical protein